MNLESELIEKIKNGDRSAFRELVEANKKNVYYLAFDLCGNREDAEDISQEVFVKAFRSIDSFRGESKISTWLYTITVNSCFSMKRKLGYKVKNRTDEITEFADKSAELQETSSFADPESQTDAHYLKKHIKTAMEKLSPRERSVFTLRYFNELAFVEIVEIMKINPSTVRSLNFRALKKLKKELSFYQAGY